DIGSGGQQFFHALQTVLASREHQRGDASAVGITRASEREFGSSRVQRSHLILVTGLAIGSLGLFALLALFPLLSSPQPSGALVRFGSLPDRRSQIRTAGFGIEAGGGFVIRAARQQQLDG